MSHLHYSNPSLAKTFQVVLAGTFQRLSGFLAHSEQASESHVLQDLQDRRGTRRPAPTRHLSEVSPPPPVSLALLPCSNHTCCSSNTASRSCLGAFALVSPCLRSFPTDSLHVQIAHPFKISAQISLHKKRLFGPLFLKRYNSITTPLRSSFTLSLGFIFFIITNDHRM